MTIELDGRLMTDKTSAHDLLRHCLNFPEYYGRNLDALYDLLTEISGPVCIKLFYSGQMQEQLGDYGAALLATIYDASEKNPCLSFEIL